MEKLGCKIHERVGGVELAVHTWEHVGGKGHLGLLFALAHLCEEALGTLFTSQERCLCGRWCGFHVSFASAHSEAKDIGPSKLVS